MRSASTGAAYGVPLRRSSAQQHREARALGPELAEVGGARPPPSSSPSSSPARGLPCSSRVASVPSFWRARRARARARAARGAARSRGGRRAERQILEVLEPHARDVDVDAAGRRAAQPAPADEATREEPVQRHRQRETEAPPPKHPASAYQHSPRGPVLARAECGTLRAWPGRCPNLASTTTAAGRRAHREHDAVAGPLLREIDERRREEHGGDARRPPPGCPWRRRR